MPARAMAALAVVAGSVLTLVLALATTSSTPFVQPGQVNAPAPRPSLSTSPTRPHTPPLAPPHLPRGSGNTAVTAIGTVLLVLLAAALLALVALVARTLWRSRPRPQPAVPEEDWEPLPDLPASIRADAQAQQELLAWGSPRDAIVACWVRLQELCAAAGVPAQPAETAAELTARVLAAPSVAGEQVDEPIHELAALYQEARFSTHEMGQPARAAAAGALARLHEQLADGAFTVPAAAAPTPASHPFDPDGERA